MIHSRALRADLLLLLTAFIWGFGFVAQRIGMQHIGPFAFSGLRFLLGAASLLPLMWWLGRGRPRSGDRRTLLWGGLVAGAFLFIGASLQQVGLVYTTAGKAGFITGLYIVIVPLLGLLWGQRTRRDTWLGALLALIGLYLLSVSEDFTLAYGDLLELIGAFFWAGHVLVIGWLAPRCDVLALSFLQFLACGLLSLLVAAAIETTSVAAVLDSATAIAYAGVMSVGVAFTLQVLGQREAPASHAAILLSLEAFFAALGGMLILDESLGARGATGCALMLAGMLISQGLLGRRRGAAG